MSHGYKNISDFSYSLFAIDIKSLIKEPKLDINVALVFHSKSHHSSGTVRYPHLNVECSTTFVIILSIINLPAHWQHAAAACGNTNISDLNDAGIRSYTRDLVTH